MRLYGRLASEVLYAAKFTDGHQPDDEQMNVRSQHAIVKRVLHASFTCAGLDDLIGW